MIYVAIIAVFAAVCLLEACHERVVGRMRVEITRLLAERADLLARIDRAGGFLTERERATLTGRANLLAVLKQRDGSNQ